MSSRPIVRARMRAVREAARRAPRRFPVPMDGQGRPLRVSEFFGMNAFRGSAAGSPADATANEIRAWALARGATHFCHWFQPQTGATAEKHDAFLNLDGESAPIELLSALELRQSESDASSFPSGGMRTTFEARGYTAWDPSSPVFLVEHDNGATLCIPSVFISYHGDALDEKTALLRSIDALSAKACALLAAAGDEEVARVTPMLGVEQEFFLVDRAFYALRPDLVMTGRTLLGAGAPKGQQLEDHYLGSIPARVQAFMSEVELTLFKLGVPAKTRHNEVAPGQFEMAPIYEEANLATDHNQITMEVLRKVAARHDFAVLLHEKPFAGINGSGKHCNWSLRASAPGRALDGKNLFAPGRAPGDNLRFLLMLAGVLIGVHRHAALLRAAIASAANDHRLGANEAPPAIVSVFLGAALDRMLDRIEAGEASGPSAEAAVIALGTSNLPDVLRDNTDRNRTSPFAFTGNRFELRAVGSSASTAFPIAILNAATAEAFGELAEALGRARAGGASREEAALRVLRDAIAATRAVRFEGNNYAREWIEEARRRGLPNVQRTPEALGALIAPASIRLLSSLGVLREAELRARHAVRLERYAKNVQIEADTLRGMIDTQVLPAAYGWHGELLSLVAAAASLGTNVVESDALARLSAVIESLHSSRGALEAALRAADEAADGEERARLLSVEVAGAMAGCRAAADELEAILPDDRWPLPKYREMLFIE